MSTLRRFAVAGAFALPVSLLAVPASASTSDTPWSAETSSSYAGIGGAGTTDTDEGATRWGYWSEEDTVVAGIGGAAVIHSEQSDADDDYGHPDWSGDDDHAAVTHGRHPAATRHHDRHVTHARPADHEASYVAEAQTADVTGAASSHTESHAGDDYATYESGNHTAGPDGASSEGVHAVAVDDHAEYHTWYAAADEAGAIVHSVSTVADASDDAWGDDEDED
ncbi:hypothetical protein [Amycolatopsis solani]|uniref:hypothetical protein n=1 Tax=Amycolatopsis solani TaxID=3028615 RepID=UPI0025B14075|nr:hypothetical protein [Amycolatopsis sp. MEP2-6]